MNLFSAVLSFSISRSDEFRAQFERQTYLWGQQPGFLWSSLLQRDEVVNKFLVCTAWSVNDDRAFAAGLSSLSQFQEMFARIEEFQSLETFENRPDAETETVTTSQEEHEEHAGNRADFVGSSAATSAIDWRTGQPLDWPSAPEDDEELNDTSDASLVQPTESSSIIAGLIGHLVGVWSQGDAHTSRDIGTLVAYDERWLQIETASGETLFFPIVNVRLLKPLR